MAESAFAEKACLPQAEALRGALGESALWWNAAVALSQGGGEWKFYTRAAGWVYQVKQGKRTLFYMLPKAGRFKLTFVFGARAVEAADAAGLPPQVLEALLTARAYAEGRSVAIEVCGEADYEVFKKLLRLKQEYYSSFSNGS